MIVRRDECEQAAARHEAPEEKAAFLAECRQSSRV